MPAKYFIFPNGKSVPIKSCLNSCHLNERCMFVPTLRAVAKLLERGLSMTLRLLRKILMFHKFQILRERTSGVTSKFLMSWDLMELRIKS